MYYMLITQSANANRGKASRDGLGVLRLHKAYGAHPARQNSCSALPIPSSPGRA